MFSRTHFALTALAISVGQSYAQTPAFPGALGYGAYATGGRNGSVYHVTNLNDSGAGSFRTGVGSGNRVIVFDVGGHVTLLSAISCQGNITIAGQTAPGGICFDGHEISFSSRANIICRYIRIRPGSSAASSELGFGMYQTTNAILDHDSIAFAPYDNVDAVSANNLTFQNCINADPIGQQFGAHIENVGAFCSWHYNIFANSHNRNPLAKINTTFINNVEYNNQAGYTTHTSTHFSHDLVNNYFVAGPSSGGDFPWYQIDNNQSMYFTGNYYDSAKNGTLTGSLTAPLPGYQGGGTILTAPFSSWTAVIPTVPAALAWRYDLSAAGAFPRDDMDSLIVGQMQSLGTSGQIYTSQTQTGLANNGWGTITGGVAPANFSGDGIADYWKLAVNLNTNVSYPLTNTASGYTLLENYLNFLGTPHAVTQTNTPVLINLAQFTAGFSASAIFSVTNATNGTVSIVSGTNANFIPTANFNGLGTFNFNVSESSYTLSAAVTICVTPVSPPASAAGFNGALVTVATNALATVTAPPNNLLWRGDGTANGWNTSVSNWLNGAASSKYKDGDVVTFDDTGSASPAINLTAGVSPGAILFNDNQNYTLSGSGALSGSATLSKTGSGTLAVNTTNSGFAGAINVRGGTLALNCPNSAGSAPVTLAGNATLSLAGGVGYVQVSGNVTVPAGETATINSGYIGNGGYGSFISGDTNSVLNLVGSQAFGGGSSSQFSQFNGTIHIVSGSIRFSTASSGNTFGSLTPNFIIDGTLQPRNAGNTITIGALNGSGSLQGPQTAGTGTGATVFNVGGKNIDAVFNGTIISNANSAGSAICFLKTGNGTQTLNGINTFTGTNAVLAGTLLLNGSSVASLTTIFSNATLGGTGFVSSGAVRVNPGGIFSPGAAAGSAGTFTINGNLTNNSPILNFDLSPSPGGANDHIFPAGVLAMTGVQQFNFNLTGNALGAGTYSLIDGAAYSTQTGASFASNLPGNTRQNISFSVSPPNTYPGYVHLVVSGAASSLLWSGTNSGTWDTGTTNWLNGANADQYYNLDTVTFDDTSTNGAVSIAGTLQPGAILVTNNSLAYTFSGNGALTGSEPLTKAGGGALTFATTNSAFTGSIALTGGTLAVSSGASIGSGSLTIGNSATFALPASGSSVFFGGPVSVPAGQTANITSGVLSSGFSGNFSSGNNAGVLNLSGGFSFSGISSAQFYNFTGIINLQPGGTLRYSANSSGNTFGSFNPTLVINGTLQPRNAGNTVQLGAFSGTGIIAGPQSNSGTGDTLYVIGGNNTSASFSGVISSNTAVAGSQVIINKIGTGTLTLSGVNTFAGGTTVSAGTLLVNNTAGSATGTGDLEIFSGATLAGNGIISSSTTIDNGATLAPGNPNGTLTIANNLTLNDSSISQFSLGANSGSVFVSGDLFLTGQLQVTNGAGFGVGTYTLFTCGGALTLGNFALASAPAGWNYNFNTNTPGVVKLIVAPTAPPNFSAASINAGSLTLHGSNGVPQGNYLVQQSSNLVSWITIATNQFDANGGFDFTTNAPASSPQNFFRLQLQ